MNPDLNHTVSKKARLETGLMPESTDNVTCYNFRFLMKEQDSVSLNVYIQRSGVDHLVLSINGEYTFTTFQLCLKEVGF